MTIYVTKKDEWKTSQISVEDFLSEYCSKIGLKKNNKDLCEIYSRDTTQRLSRSTGGECINHTQTNNNIAIICISSLNFESEKYRFHKTLE